MTVRVLIVSAVRLYRDGLRAVLEREGAMIVTGCAAPGASAADLLDAQQPQVVLLDTTATDVPTAVATLRRRSPTVKVVALTLSDVEGDVLACVEAGIAGYVSRDGSLDDLRVAVESAMRDELTCSPRVAATMLRRLATLAAERRANGAAADVEVATLTPREAEVARLIERGLSNKQIAVRLCIELATVKNHVHRVLEKLHVHRRGEIGARVRVRADAASLPDGERRADVLRR